VGPSSDFDGPQFDSDFECGNLDCAIHLGGNEFDLFLRPDANTHGHFMWFYFSVRGLKRGEKIKLNIVNMTKKHSLYLQGMQVNILSERKSLAEGVGWVKGGENI